MNITRERERERIQTAGADLKLEQTQESGKQVETCGIISHVRAV